MSESMLGHLFVDLGEVADRFVAARQTMNQAEAGSIRLDSMAPPDAGSQHQGAGRPQESRAGPITVKSGRHGEDLRT